MNNGIVMIPQCDMVPFSEAMMVGDAGAEIAMMTSPKTTTQTKEETIAVRAANRESERELQKTIIAIEAANIKRQFLCVVVFGIIMLFVTLMGACVAFGTPEWRIYTVENGFNPLITPDAFPCRLDSSVSTCQFTVSRKRGLFATCYEKPAFLNQVYPVYAFTLAYNTDMQCVWEQKYNIQNTPIIITNNCDQENPLGYTSIADLNTNLMRAQWMCFALAIAMLFVSLVLSLASFACIRVLGLMLAGIMTLFSTFLLVAGMALFHGYIDIEENQLRCPPFFATLKKSIYSNLYMNTRVTFGFSFWLGWASAATSVVACAFLLGAACKRRASMKIIDKAIERLRDLNKDEKLDKRYEAMQEKIRRKEAALVLKEEEERWRNMKKVSYNPPPMQQGVILDPRMNAFKFMEDPNKRMMDKLRMEKMALQDKYAMFEDKSEARLQMIEEKMKYELEEEKMKLEIEKRRMIDAAKKREKKLEKNERPRNEANPMRMGRWLGKFRKPTKKYYHSDDSYDSDETCGHMRGRKPTPKYAHNAVRKQDSINYYQRSSSLNGGRQHCALPAPPMGICSDPYTLHLPTGGNRY